jgi:phosphoglycolate phosphatase
MVHVEVNEDIIENIELLVFDKDGTLIDLYNYWANMVGYRVNYAQDILGFNDDKKTHIMYAMGIDLKERRLKVEGPVGIKKREIVMQAMVDALLTVGYRNTYELCLEAFREVDTLSVKKFPEIIKPVEGMYQIIDSLCKKKCKIAIATTDETERASMALEFLGISDKVDIVVGSDMVDNCKPYPDIVNMITRKLSIAKMNTVIVGDAIADIEMGINACTRASIGVMSGISSKRDLLRVTPYVVPDISYIGVRRI